MTDPLLRHLVRIAESFSGSQRLEIPIALQVHGAKFSGVLISSAEFSRMIRNSELHASIERILETPLPPLMKSSNDSTEYLHLLGGDGDDPTQLCWRFRIDVIDGFTLGGIPSMASAAD